MGSLYCQLEVYYSNKIELNALLKKVAKLFHYPRTSNLKDNFKNAFPYPVIDESSNKKTYKAKLQGYVKWVTILHTIFDIPLHVFDLTHSEQLNALLSKKIPGRLSVYPLKNFDSDTEWDRNVKGQEYQNALIEFLEPLKTNLFIYDYLQRQYHPKELYLKAYVDAHNELYKKIKTRLQQKEPFKYARVLVLPNNSENAIDENADAYEIKREILKNCPVPLFEHICCCLKNFSAMSDTKEEQMGFYCQKRPTRLYHYALINDGEFLMTEHYRYNREKRIKPDILFIEEGKGELSKMRQLYLAELKKLTSNKRIKLTKSDIISIVSSLSDDEAHFFIADKQKLVTDNFN